MKQQETGSIVVPQLADRQLKFFRQVEATQSCRRCRRLDHRLHGSRSSLEFRLMRATTIDGDGQHPRLERSHTIPVFQITNRPDERLLGDILRVLAMPLLAHADREDQPLKLLDELQQPASVAS